MNGVLLTAGVVAILAAVLGGGLQAFDLTVPVIASRARQALLFLVGVALIVAAWVLRERDDSAGVAAYRAVVGASCERLGETTGRAFAPGVYESFRDQTFRKEPLVADLRGRIATFRGELTALWQRPAPGSLADERAAAEEATRDWLAKFEQRMTDVSALPGNVVTQAQVAALSTPDDTAARVRANDAMSALAGKNCAIAGA